MKRETPPEAILGETDQARWTDISEVIVTATILSSQHLKDRAAEQRSKLRSN